MFMLTAVLVQQYGASSECRMISWGEICENIHESFQMIEAVNALHFRFHGSAIN